MHCWWEDKMVQLLINSSIPKRNENIGAHGKWYIHVHVRIGHYGQKAGINQYLSITIN
jgi:hypothetical protein